MSHLRKQLIRLAHENPGEVREAVLPLLKEAAWKPPKLTKTLARMVAEESAKHLIADALNESLTKGKGRGLEKIREALAKTVIRRDSRGQMRAQVELQPEVGKWSKGLSRDDLIRFAKMVEEIQERGKMQTSEEGWKKLSDSQSRTSPRREAVLPLLKEAMRNIKWDRGRLEGHYSTAGPYPVFRGKDQEGNEWRIESKNPGFTELYLNGKLVRKGLLDSSQAMGQARRMRVAKGTAKEAQGEKAKLTKWMKYVEVPEDELIVLAKRAEDGELGPRSKEILKYLDEAIDKLSLARNAMFHAKARMR